MQLIPKRTATNPRGSILGCAFWLVTAMGCGSSPHASSGASGASASQSGSSGARGSVAGMSTTGTSTAGQAGLGGRGASGHNASAGAGSQAPALIDAGSDDDGPDDTDASTGTHAVRSTGPGDWVAGDYPPDLMGSTYREISGVPGQGSNVRQYKVHIPPGYKASVPTPVVFCIHGLGQDAVLFCVTGAAMNTKSDEAGFVLVMPNGHENSWNAGTCCGSASTDELDDVALMRAIFKEVGQHVNIDLDRVYATGLSNGGYMSYRLACEAADIFAAVAPGAGALGKNDIGGGTNSTSNLTKCEPSQPVSVLDIHGTSDPLIAYSLQAPSLTQLAMKNGCAATTASAIQPMSAGDTKCVSYAGCPSGIDVTGCSIDMGGHCWFGSPDCGTGGGDIGIAIVGANSDTMKNTDAVWEFFKHHTR